MTVSRRHRFSEGQGFGDVHTGFDLEVAHDGDRHRIDPADSHALADLLDPEDYTPDGVDLDALLSVGLDYLSIAQYEQAIDCFARVVWFAPEDARVAMAAWVNRGVAHGQLEEYDEAIGAAREAIRIGADAELEALAETNLAYALWESGDSSRPLSHAERAVELDPRSAEVWYNLGFLYNERAQHEAAVEALECAETLGFGRVRVREERERALDALGADVAAEPAVETADRLRDGSERQAAGGRDTVESGKGGSVERLGA